VTNMDQSFDHLDVVNGVLGLACNLESYPNHLFKAGYKIARIEPKFNVGGTVNPDILFVSDNMGLFAECKSGEYKTGANLGKYDLIQLRHLIEKGIDISDENMALDIGIFGKANLIKLNQKLLEEGIDYSQVILSSEIKKIYGRSFKDPLLESLFSDSVVVKSKPPLMLRFTEGSDFKRIAPFVFNTLMSRSLYGKTQFKVQEITAEIVGEVWDKLDKDLKKSMIKKVKRFLNICKRKHLKGYLQNNKDSWVITIGDHWKSRKKFSDDCDRLINSLNQRELFEFFKFAKNEYEDSVEGQTHGRGLQADS
jgi:hypothetical protein